MSTPVPPDYLGDAVYATDDGYGLRLTTDHHEPAHAGNVIVLDPEVIAALERYIARWKAVRQ